MGTAKEREFDMIVAGVGGQGVLTLSDMIGLAAVEDEFEVAIGEVFGLSQRGGDVFTKIRLSKTEKKSIWIPSHSADLIVGLEPLEALRLGIQYLNQETIVCVDPRKIAPISVLIGEQTYPTWEWILERLSNFSKKLYIIEASKTAVERFKDIRMANVLMFGTLAVSRLIPIKYDAFLKTIEKISHTKRASRYMDAFNAGIEMMHEPVLTHK